MEKSGLFTANHHLKMLLVLLYTWVVILTEWLYPNKRIVSIEKDTVSFKWRDYKDDNKHKVMTLPTDEFIRRFLIHILPSGFMKIRHYGLLGNRNKTTKLKICKQLTHTPLLTREKASTLQLIQKLTGIDLSKCPICGSEKLKRFMSLGKSPPINNKTAYV